MVKPVVQQKGRFKILSENEDLEKVAPSPSLHKSHSMQHSGIPPSPSCVSSPPVSAQNSGISPSPTVSGPSILPLLQSVLQTNMLQKETILGLMKQVYLGDNGANRGGDGGSALTSPAASEKEMSGASHARRGNCFMR